MRDSKQSSSAVPAGPNEPSEEDSAGTAEPLCFKPLNQEEHIEKSKRFLPHWEQPGCTYFVTFRMADSMPQAKLRLWQREKELWESSHPKPWSNEVWSEYHRTFEGEMQRWLDAGHGSSLLRVGEIRKIVVSSLHHFDGGQYRLGDYVVMPNHVHVLFTPLPGFGMKKLVNAWKSFTGHKILRATGGKPPFWQWESYDHVVRSERQLGHYERYIADNPVKAGLKPEEFTHFQSPK